MEAGKDLANAFNDNSQDSSQTQMELLLKTKLVIEKINLLSTELGNVNAKLKSRSYY